MSEKPSSQLIGDGVSSALEVLSKIEGLIYCFDLLLGVDNTKGHVGTWVDLLWKQFTRLRERAEQFETAFDMLAPWWVPQVQPTHLNESSHLVWVATSAAWFLAVDRLAAKYTAAALLIMGRQANPYLTGIDRIVEESPVWKAKYALLLHESEDDLFISVNKEAPKVELLSEAASLSPLSIKRERVSFAALVRHATKAVGEVFAHQNGPAFIRDYRLPYGFEDPWNESVEGFRGHLILPEWNKVERKLWFAGELILHYEKKIAHVAGLILDKFQDQNWPESLTFDLNQKQIQDAKDAINKKICDFISTPPIAFARNGTAKGLSWTANS